MLHHVCRRLTLPYRYWSIHHEAPGYEHLATLPTHEGTGDVIRNKDEQSALHTLLLGHPPRRTAHGSCTTMPDVILRRAPFSQPGADYRARKSALKAPQVSESSYSAGSKGRLIIAVDTLHGAADRLAGLVVIHAHEPRSVACRCAGTGSLPSAGAKARTATWPSPPRLRAGDRPTGFTRSWALPSALRRRLWPVSGSDQGAVVRNVMVLGPTVSGPAG
jgi:hypothetical protein